MDFPWSGLRAAYKVEEWNSSRYLEDLNLKNAVVAEDTGLLEEPISILSNASEPGNLQLTFDVRSMEASRLSWTEVPVLSLTRPLRCCSSVLLLLLLLIRGLASLGSN